MKIIKTTTLLIIGIVFLCKTGNAQQANIQPKVASTPENNKKSIIEEDKPVIKVEELKGIPAQKSVVPGDVFTTAPEMSSPPKTTIQEPADRIEQKRPPLPVNEYVAPKTAMPERSVFQVSVPIKQEKE